jgi:hypothetical protein
LGGKNRSGEQSGSQGRNQQTRLHHHYLLYLLWSTGHKNRSVDFSRKSNQPPPDSILSDTRTPHGNLPQTCNLLVVRYARMLQLKFCKLDIRRFDFPYLEARRQVAGSLIRAGLFGRQSGRFGV